MLKGGDSVASINTEALVSSERFIPTCPAKRKMVIVVKNLGQDYVDARLK